MDFQRLQSQQLENDTAAEPAFWALPRPARLQRLGLRLAVQMPSILKYRTSNSVARQDVLLKAMKLALGVASTLGVDAEEVVEFVPAYEVGQGFERLALSAVGDIADAGEKIDHLEEFAALARRGVGELLSIIAAQAEYDDIDLQEMLLEEAPAVRKQLP